MTPRRSLSVVVGLLLAIAGSTTPLGSATWNPCADGGSERPDEGGIGGTGARPGADEGGIGGTGFTGSGPIGVIGTVTGFGSICVGPTEVHYDEATPVSVAGETTTAGALAVGQVVELLADATNGELRAREVVVRHIAQGPLTAYEESTGRFEVMGQTVLRSPATTLGDQSTYWPVGTTVRVSGLRRADGAIVATHVVRLESADTVWVTGPWHADTLGASVGGTSVATTSTGEIPEGAEVRAVGRWRDGAIRAEMVEVMPTVPFAGRVDRVALEGFVRPATDGALRVDSFAITGTGAETIATASGIRVRVEAIVRDRGLVVERLERIDVLQLRPSRFAPPSRGPADGRGRAGAPGRDGMPPPRPDGGPRPREGMERLERPDRPDQMPRPDRPERPAPPDRPDVPRPERPNQTRPDRPPPPPERVGR